MAAELERIDGGKADPPLIATVIVWEKGACPWSGNHDCATTHGPGSMVMVFDQFGGAIAALSGEWVEQRVRIFDAVFKGKGPRSVELHLDVPYMEEKPESYTNLGARMHRWPKNGGK